MLSSIDLLRHWIDVGESLPLKNVYDENFRIFDGNFERTSQPGRNMIGFL
jgi:hypothetical protein